MIVLAIDTAGVDCSAAVYDSSAGVVLGSASETIGRGHAEKLMEMIDRALADAGIDLDAVERIAVTVGPGSFTGIRVGVSAARGLALALGVPAVGVSTLAVLAAAMVEERGERPILAAIDAKRGEVYVQAFSSSGEPMAEAKITSIDAASGLGDGLNPILTGSAATLLSGGTGETQPDRYPIAVVARLGAAARPDEKPKPLYLRGPGAKPQTGFAIARM
ncbi:MAG TPA: tRNA (adenosine(37)-N6)-threonylcarbamoyltransferase complex dimerization subunit type 1 TsaB [Rhizobium sp.]|nr:tRNA (adenosine(37)-N6)-threonylcarbamoyltransferase complex dimerization subunit type 1 TsaB [Rhizobium sp.]